jgi:hypothetical protein
VQLAQGEGECLEPSCLGAKEIPKDSCERMSLAQLYESLRPSANEFDNPCTL